MRRLMQNKNLSALYAYQYTCIKMNKYEQIIQACKDGDLQKLNDVTYRNILSINTWITGFEHAVKHGHVHIIEKIVDMFKHDEKCMSEFMRILSRANNPVSYELCTKYCPKMFSQLVLDDLKNPARVRSNVYDAFTYTNINIEKCIDIYLPIIKCHDKNSKEIQEVIGFLISKIEENPDGHGMTRWQYKTLTELKALKIDTDTLNEIMADKLNKVEYTEQSCTVFYKCMKFEHEKDFLDELTKLTNNGTVKAFQIISKQFHFGRSAPYISFNKNLDQNDIKDNKYVYQVLF